MAAWAQERDRRPLYSYRDDPNVPSFPDDRPLLVFDGQCVMCSGFAQVVARRDRPGRIRFTAAQSPLGAALCRHYGLKADDPETNLMITNGRALGKLEAYTAIMRALGGGWQVLSLFHVLPQAARDWLYDRLAKNRYAVFARRDVCVVPDASWRDRVLE